MEEEVFMDKSELRKAISRLEESRELLSSFVEKKDAVEYLVKETGLSEEECLKAYNFLMNLDTSNVRYE